jgi:hypothetical protein
MTGYHESIKFDDRALNGPGVLAAVVKSATHHPVTLNNGDPLPQFRRVDSALLPRRSAPDNNQIVVLISHDLLVLNYSLELWQLRRIPSTANGFDEEDAGIYASPLNVDVIALICQQHRLRCDDLEIVVDPALVPISKELK